MVNLGGVPSVVHKFVVLSSREAQIMVLLPSAAGKGFERVRESCMHGNFTPLA